MAGGALLVVSGLFPWFSAGAIATDPLRGHALVAAVIGVLVVVVGVFGERDVRVWQGVCGFGAVVVGALVVAAAVLPPDELTASLGAGLATVGAVLVGTALFAFRWRRNWSAPEHVDVAESNPPGATSSRIRRAVAGVAAVLVVAVAFLVVWPSGVPTLRSVAFPTDSHAAALARFDDITADEDDQNVFEPCRSQLLSHGERTDVSVVLFHGLTNCPKQFLELGTRLFDQGANVVILRAPEHGVANADGSGIGGVANVGDLTAEDLRAYADASVDIATGLGDEVRVLGLSMGGVVAAWTAQERDDVDRVVAVAPALTIPFVPASLTHVFRNIAGKIPNVSLPSSGNELDHTYAGETTKGLNATFSMAAYVADRGYGASPAAADVIVVLNPDDEQVDPTHLSEFTSAWAAHGGPVTLRRLPAVGLPHDVIDLDQPDADPELVYPILIDILDGRTQPTGR